MKPRTFQEEIEDYLNRAYKGERFIVAGCEQLIEQVSFNPTSHLPIIFWRKFKKGLYPLSFAINDIMPERLTKCPPGKPHKLCKKGKRT